MQQHTIKGDWVPADSSGNHLELAPTTDPSVLAIRGTYEPERVMFATPTQLDSLAKSWQQGTFQKIAR